MREVRRGALERKVFIGQRDGSMVPVVEIEPKAPNRRFAKTVLWKKVRLCLVPPSRERYRCVRRPFADNDCYQQEGWDGIERLRQGAPDDPLVIRMYAMWKGLCTLIEEGKITRERGAEIFELERSRAIIARQQDETRIKRKISA